MTAYVVYWLSLLLVAIVLAARLRRVSAIKHRN